MQLLSVHDEHKYFAEWTLPGLDQKNAGNLTFTPERAELNLNNALTSIRGAISVAGPLQIYPAVHGISSVGEALTLLNAQSLGLSLPMRSAGVRQPEQLISSSIVVGAHVEPETLYKSVHFFIPALEVWLSQSAISHSIEDATIDGKHTDSFVVRPPETEKTSVSHIGAVLEWASYVKVASHFTYVDVTVRGYVTIRPESPRTLAWFLEQHHKLATLLAFMAGTPMPIGAIQASLPQSNFPVSVLVSMRQAEPCNFKSPYEFFVPRAALGSSFPTVVEQWFREIDSVLIPSKLALSVLSTKNLWLHVEFLSLAQALEGFHRGRFPGSYMDNTEYEKSVKKVLIDALPSIVASDHRDSLVSRIRYGNQISLAKRLNELRDIIGDQLAKAIIGGSGKVPRSWIDTRNQ